MLNAILPPLVAALRLPFMLVLGFLIVLVLDALMLLAADSLTDGDLSVDGFWWALLVALVASAVTLVLEVVAGVDDDSEYSFRVIQRIARRTGRADADGRPRDHLPRDRRARAAQSSGARCGTATPPTWPAGSPRTGTT